MPLYEYQCDACAHRFEVIQKYSDPKIDVCPKCGGTVSKLLSSPAIQFKGSGFYLTDYGRAGKTDSGNVSAGRNDSGGSGTESKPEAKAEPAADAKPAPAPSASTTKSD
jgi:putative FmdB family regulatory protein